MNGYNTYNNMNNGYNNTSYTNNNPYPSNLYPNLHGLHAGNFAQPTFIPRDYSRDAALGGHLDTVIADLSFFKKSSTPPLPERHSHRSHCHHHRPIVINQGPSWMEQIFWFSLLSRQNPQTIVIDRSSPHHHHSHKKEDHRTAFVVVAVVSGIFALIAGYCLGRDFGKRQEVQQAKADLADLSKQFSYTYAKENPYVYRQMNDFTIKARTLLDQIEHNTFIRSMMKVVAIITAIGLVVGCVTAAVPLAVFSGLAFFVNAVAYMIFAGITCGEQKRINRTYDQLFQEAETMKTNISNMMNTPPVYRTI